MTAKRAQCKKCLSDLVTWYQTKGGRWVLMNVEEYPNGSRYLRAPHYQTCTGDIADRETACLMCGQKMNNGAEYATHLQQTHGYKSEEPAS